MPTRALVTRYEQELERFPDLWHRVGLGLGAAVVLGFPFLASARWLTVGTQALTAVVGSVGLMILTGFAEQISLGHAAFLALGAYTVAGLGVHLHVPFWLGIPAGGLVAALVGLLVGPFALRLRGLYLAIVTIGLLFLVEHSLLSLSGITGGVGGTPVPLHSGFRSPEGTSSLGDWSGELTLGGLTLSFGQKLYFVFLAITVSVVILCANIRKSWLGRSMMAVRDSDLAASALGVHPARAKITAFGLSSFFAGVAGGMFACQQQYLTVSPPFNLNMSIQYIVMCVLGGVGTTFGAVAGAVCYVFFEPLAQMFGSQVPFLTGMSSAQQSTVMFSVVVCLLLVFEPLGLFGVWLRIQRYFLGWPFRY